MITLYADDTLFYVSDPVRSLPELLTGLEVFGRVSGLRVNPAKSLLFPMGALRGKKSETLPSLPIRWEVE